MWMRSARYSDLWNVLAVERAAFPTDEEARLVEELILDPSAQPVLSLLAFENERPVGHILFTRAWLEPSAPLSIAILAPLAVIPEFQRKGIGGKLIRRGLELLAQSGTDLVFVLGHPDYYPRHGFQPAIPLGFSATYPIPEKATDAWMVHALRPRVLGKASGRVICADTLNNPVYWRE